MSKWCNATFFLNYLFKSKQLLHMACKIINVWYCANICILNCDLSFFLHLFAYRNFTAICLTISPGIIPKILSHYVLIKQNVQHGNRKLNNVRPRWLPLYGQKTLHSLSKYLLLICLRRDQHQCAVGTHEQTASGVCLTALLEEETINSIDYEFHFHLEIRGPYLLAGQFLHPMRESRIKYYTPDFQRNNMNTCKM